MSQNQRDPLTVLLRQAPVGHALWRASECYVLSRIEMRKPVLDLGCGDGLLASVLGNDAFLAGVDLRAAELRQARRTGKYRLLMNGDATRLPLRSSIFGTVLSNCVLEHIPRLGGALAEVKRVLRPGGEFVFTAPSERFDELLLYPSLMRRMGLGRLAKAYQTTVNRTFRHYHMLSPDEWEARLEDAGMRVRGIQYFLPPETMRFWDLFLPASVPAKITKVLLGRWTVGWRGWVVLLWHHYLDRLVRAPCTSGGGLVVRACKPEQAGDTGPVTAP